MWRNGLLKEKQGSESSKGSSWTFFTWYYCFLAQWMLFLGLLVKSPNMITTDRFKILAAKNSLDVTTYIFFSSSFICKGNSLILFKDTRAETSSYLKIIYQPCTDLSPTSHHPVNLPKQFCYCQVILPLNTDL